MLLLVKQKGFTFMMLELKDVSYRAEDENGVTPAQEKPKASRKRKNGNKQGTGGKAPEQAPAPKPEKPKPENPFKKGEDGVSKYHKDMGLDTPERVAAYKQARMKHHSIVWVEYVHSTGYKGKALGEKYGKDIEAEARKRAVAEVCAK